MSGEIDKPAELVPDARGQAVDAFDDEAVSEIFRAWKHRCISTGCDVGPADGEERFSLLVALEMAAPPNALARVRGLLDQAGRESLPGITRSPATLGARREALEEAAGRWGARIGSPVLVVRQIVLLRHLVTGSAQGDRLGRLVDRAMEAATRSATDELQHAAFSDPLTGCANRRGLEMDLNRELARCKRAELDLSVVALDVDGLKQINDSQGHAAGDRTLLLLVETLRRTLRGLDGVYRVGGDEFIVVLPDTSPEGAAVVMSRVESLDPPAFTWGVAGVQQTRHFEPGALLAAADERLYAHRRSVRGARSLGSQAVANLRDDEELPDSQAGAIG